MAENLYTENCIRTFTGKYFDPFNPDPEMICIEDIAHALSHQCRFGGHLPEFYSVAEHCYHVSNAVPAEHRLAGLLHDASEAYLLDIPRPLKSRLTNYKEVEDKLMRVIAQKFGFEYPLHESVKKADETLLVWEWEQLFIKTHPVILDCFTSHRAKMFFIHVFSKYTNQ